ncbi:TonB-dependent receptor [Ochrovirga pacifica]|uniref:TonB-dependent receptor n=1 Tax=Ochrovirga pacifica TaxID=1042376 RepID=UPI000255A2B5|nr:TonB-dependent receptor plug domain-containing protein [Ochrovirga pacifica]
MRTKLLLTFFTLLCVNFYGQNTVIVKGKVVNSQDNTPVITATISVTKSPEIGVVDENGAFVLEIKKAPPVEIHINAIGYKEYKQKVYTTNKELLILLEEDVTSLDQVVISASRTPERVFESPVSIERMGAKVVETTTSPSFYDGLENLKGVDINSSSLTFKSINTRGFASFANTRFVQLVDGMDNSSPGLNFPLGNLIGLNELDVQSVELLPGASSALYGANAFNGIMFMRSKNPFTHQGTSVYGKAGVTSSENAGTNSYVDVGARVAKKINDKFAVKFTTSFLKATDWFATDTRNLSDDGVAIDGDRSTLDYNGINIYGDIIKTDIKEVAQSLEAMGARTLGGNPIDADDFNKEDVSRTGYAEQDLINNDTDNFRAALALHFKPFENDKDTEIIFSSKFGTGNTMYHGASRYALRNFIMHQHKLEFQSKHLMFRSYITLEDAGDSYDVRFAGINTLSANGANNQWFGTYATVYASAINGELAGSGVPANVPTAAHAVARLQADTAVRLEPGTEEFKNTFNQVIKNPDLLTGAKFVDSSKLFHSDLNYNFKELIEFAEVQIGGSARRYVLNSQGTIFTDTKDEDISYDEYGIYTQLQKKVWDNKVKLTGSIRYDKAQNFDGNFSPRFSASYSPDVEKNHNIRASVQTGFRNPTTQDQYIGLNLGNAILIGSAADNLSRYQLDVPNSGAAQQQGFAASTNFTGTLAYQNSFTLSSIRKFSATQNPADLQAADVTLVKPEQVTSYEVGYRGKVAKRTVLDISAYYSQYRDFISINTVITPHYGSNTLQDIHPVINVPNAVLAVANGDYTAVRVYTNSKVDVSSVGVNAGLETKVFGDFDFGINYTYASQDFDQSEDPDFATSFNTPEHKVKIAFGHDNVYKGLGFGINGRWQDAFYWQSSFMDGQIDARTLVDAQLMYNIANWNSKIKVGGANILGHEYQSAPGTGTIGSQFYGSWVYNF